MVYLTGDTHAEFNRFSRKTFDAADWIGPGRCTASTTCPGGKRSFPPKKNMQRG